VSRVEQAQVKEMFKKKLKQDLEKLKSSLKDEKYMV
jgi:hypothetical protein